MLSAQIKLALSAALLGTMLAPLAFTTANAASHVANQWQVQSDNQPMPMDRFGIATQR